MSGKIAVAAAACLLFSGGLAFAHRIDEYLQATILSVQANRLQASMRLIPGVLVSPTVIAGIDSNGDGVFSDEEERSYAQRVLGDLSISLDGQAIQPSLVSWSFPTPSQMRSGLGEIHIEYSANLPVGRPDRALIVTNHHLRRTSVYLVNVLSPEDGNIHILTQKRDIDQ